MNIGLIKIATAVLCALLLIFGTRTAIEIAAEHPEAELAGYNLPAPAAAPPAANEPAPGGAAAPAAFSFAKVAELLPNANAENGAGIFKKCTACHSAEKGGATQVGPNLWGVVGRKIANMEGFDYSDALKGKGGEWTFENLATFVHNPKAFAPGTKMIFPGIGDAAQLSDLVSYLRTLADTPAPLPPGP